MDDKLLGNLKVIEKKKKGLYKAVVSLRIQLKFFENLLDSTEILRDYEAQKSVQEKSIVGFDEKLCSEKNQLKICKNPMNQKQKSIDFDEEKLKKMWEKLEHKEREIEGKVKEMEFNRRFIEERAMELESRQKQLDDGFRELELKKMEYTQRMSGIINGSDAGKTMGGIEKDKIFVHVINGDAGGFRYGEFYTIDLRKRQVSECPYALLADTGCNSMVSLSSIIYVVGALRPECIRCKTKPPHSGCTKKGHYHKDMSYLDLADDHDGWKDAPGLSNGPSPSPVVLTFGGKIYLFHRLQKSQTAHIFDPVSNMWETLLPPPSVGFFNLHYSTSAVTDSQNNRILVHFYDLLSVYAYYPPNNHWELILNPFSWSEELVFLDGVIYSYLPGAPEFVSAYHVATKQSLKSYLRPSFQSVSGAALSMMLCFI